ncbi:cryptochrome/photolyase family protein [Geitlerinema sp. CS-897]|nr:cryptochrome/photolyase family protein [Geitlerinema sp. CS-897]
MTLGIWILGNQLSLEQAALASVDAPSDTPVLLIESLNFAQQRPYHRQKLVLVWSAMRHFATQLRQAGWNVTYRTHTDFETPLREWVRDNDIDDVRVVEPNDYQFSRYLQTLDLPCSLSVVENNLFLWTAAEFADWAKGRKRLLLETFYRRGRQRFNVLMDGDEPVGGQWNFDKQNRKPPKGKLQPPPPLMFPPDETTQAVMEQVRGLEVAYGEMELFGWAVTRSQALRVLEDFCDRRLPSFGPYQDAMVTGEETMWHSLISPYLNLGLLHPQEAIAAAENTYRDRNLEVAGVEGFVRQILGWREYMRGLYCFLTEEYADKNWLEHDVPLPEFFWNADKTQMNCLRQVLKQTERTGYAHHIQRLMVLANFATLAGLSPQAVKEWFHSAFIDAYDWVMQTNVIGMGTFADGGILSTKPYVSSANYINKMSDYCKACAFDRNSRTGDRACPFNFLYWHFLDRHFDKLKSLGRMNLVLSQLKKISTEELEEIRDRGDRLQQEYRNNSRTTI